MGDRNALTALFADRKIGTKVGFGFACTLVILAVVSAMAWSAFRTSAEGFSGYAQKVGVVGIARDIDRGFINLRRFAREYASSGAESNVDAVKQEQTNLRALIQRGLNEIKNPDRHRRLEDISRVVDSYLKEFDLVVTRTREQAKLLQDSLNPLGAAQYRNLDAMIAAAAASGDSNVTILASEGVKQFLLMRIDVTKVIGMHDATAEKGLEKTFADLQTVLQAIDAATKSASYRKTFEQAQAGINAYRETFRKTVALETEINGMVNGTMADMGRQVQTDAEAIKASGIADEQQEEQATLATIDQASTLILGLSIGGIVLGAALAWLIARGIAGPVVRICGAMRKLADGDHTIVVPDLGRKDEVGQMADTLEVFKDNMIEAERARVEHERHKAEAEADRKAGMLRLADSFEAGIKGVVQSVSSQATEMQAAASTLAATAQQATNQATSVAAAVEEASVSVQTVASSAEELSASVLEIARQMDQSSKIAHQAVDEAQRTNTVVEGLSKTAQGIGEVVQLIQSIANQTNLLALNATIEAARAGDAGKGFAVVASEVKSLANQTAKATSDIKTQIDDIQAATGHTVDAIRTIGGIIREMNEIAATIASAVEQQGAATREIASNVHQAAQGTSEIASNIEGVSRAAGDTGAAATQLLGAAGELSKQAETLRSDVDGFLANVRAA
jgi:methyl-accepting chemotaxis protein